MDHNAPSNPKARAHICHSQGHTKKTFGPRLPYLSPLHEVREQNEPTASHPVSQHKMFKSGGRAGIGSHIPTPRLKGEPK